MEIPNIKPFLIDGDGVLWRADQPIPGLNRFFGGLAQRGIRWALLTNNNTRTAGDYVQKLRGFGVQADESVVFTSSTATAAYLKEQYGQGAPGNGETSASSGWCITGDGMRATCHARGVSKTWKPSGN